MLKYVIVEEYSADSLETSVNRYLELGYMLHGSVCVTNIPDNRDEYQLLYTQPVTIDNSKQME